MYTLKTIARRGTALGMAVSLFVATVMPAASAFAQVALTPLTERSLLLSSSAPGWQDTDGSGFSQVNQNPAVGVNGTPAHYAPAGSGPNGKKTGETFTFKTSSTGSIEGFSLQYCTKAAGFCKAPGNNAGDYNPDDVEVGYDGSDSTRELNETEDEGWDKQTSDLNVVGTFTEATGTVPGPGQFVVLNGATQSSGWTMTSANVESEDADVDDLELTGKNNMIYLTNTTGGSVAAGTKLTIKFQPSESVFITNPGDDAFFVKINTYANVDDAEDMLPATDANIIDGGVTVANVMTDSIHIVTKVLETMSFSVGIENPDTVDEPGASVHGTCDILNQDSSDGSLLSNRLNLGDPSAEYSLETGRAWDVHSYWRLSSNSSGGASVYYSGETLSNTSGDQIANMEEEDLSRPGTEQFGLGFVDAGLDALAPTKGAQDDSFRPGHVAPRSYPFITLSTQTGAPYNGLSSQLASQDYDEASGRINPGTDPVAEPIQAKFKFLASSSEMPEVIAQQNEAVISCATAKMRYIGNIGADTPAGVYTTKINYLAAPQY